MSEEKAKIILKDGLNKREITISGRTIKAEPGKPIEVPLGDLQLWLNSGRFDRVDKPIESLSDLPVGLPGRSALEKAGINAETLSTMDKTALVAVPQIADKTADEILKFLETNKTGGQQ